MLRFGKLFIFPLLVISSLANSVAEKPSIDDATLKVKNEVVPLLVTESGSAPVKVISLNPKGPQSSLQAQLLQGLFDPQSSLGTKGILQNFYNILVAAYQEITKRQQALLDVINCTNCTNTTNPWLNFLNAVATIPSLQWVTDPNFHNSGANAGVKPLDTFIAATNQNGVVNGVGGSIINGEPVMEYTFSNNQLTPVKPPQKPAKMVQDLPLLRVLYYRV